MYFREVLIIYVFSFLLSLINGELIPVYDAEMGIRKLYDIGKPLKLSCKVTDSDEEPRDITWSKKNLENFDDRVTFEYKGKTSTFVITETNDNDNGTYVCEYRDEKFEFNVYAKVLVKIKPSTDVVVVEGEVLELKCASVGTQVEVSWTLTPEIGNTTIEEYEFKDFNNIPNSTLVIKNVKKEYRGNYTCEGRHHESLHIDDVVTSVAYVRVKDKYAALWPFILICIEVFILCSIILIYEKRRTNVEMEDSETEPDQKNGKN